MVREGLPPPAAVGSHLYVYQRALPLLTSASLKNLQGQYTHQTNPNIGYPAPGNAQGMMHDCPSRGQYYIPPAHVRSLTYPAYCATDDACVAGFTKRRAQRSPASHARSRRPPPAVSLNLCLPECGPWCLKCPSAMSKILGRKSTRSTWG